MCGGMSCSGFESLLKATQQWSSDGGMMHDSKILYVRMQREVIQDMESSSSRRESYDRSLT
jgi:hypothetical protein